MHDRARTLADDTPERCALLEVLPASARSALLREARVDRYRARQPLALAGSRPGRCWLVVDGHVKEHRGLADGSDVVTDFRGSGDLVAEAAAVDDGPTAVDVTTIDDVTALTLESSRVQQLLDDPVIAAGFQHAIAVRLLDDQRLMVRNGRPDIGRRAELALLELAERFGEDLPVGRSIGVPACQADLASWAGMSRESFAKILRRLRSHGLVTTARCDIIITDIGALRVRAGVPASRGTGWSRTDRQPTVNVV